MVVRLAAPALTSPSWTVNGTNVTIASQTWSLSSTVYNGQPLASWTQTISPATVARKVFASFTVTGGTAGTRVRIGIMPKTGGVGGANLLSPIISPGATTTIENDLPAGADAVQLTVYCMDSAPSAGRTYTVGDVSITLYVIPADLIGAALSRPLRRTDQDVINTAAYRVNFGTPGKLQGTLTYLCDSYPAAQVVDALYQGTSTVTLTTGTGNPLDGLRHVAVGSLRYGVERALPGKAPKWTLQADVREVS